MTNTRECQARVGPPLLRWALLHTSHLQQFVSSSCLSLEETLMVRATVKRLWMQRGLEFLERISTLRVCVYLNRKRINAGELTLSLSMLLTMQVTTTILQIRDEPYLTWRTRLSRTSNDTLSNSVFRMWNGTLGL